MRGMSFVFGLGLLLGMASVSLAEHPVRPSGEVPDGTLAAMGLNGMQRLNHTEGREVRGSFARAFSISGASGLIRINTGPSYSASNPALATSAAIGLVPGIRFSSGYAFAAGF